jgi:hypothetical protein
MWRSKTTKLYYQRVFKKYVLQNFPGKLHPAIELSGFCFLFPPGGYFYPWVVKLVVFSVVAASVVWVVVDVVVLVAAVVVV